MVSLSYYDMNLIRDYESDSSSSEGTDNAGRADLDYSSKAANPNNEIDVRSVRKVYLITYSQADVVRFPTRHSFVEAVLYSFHDTPAKIMHWCCCLEEHPKSGGSHFHMALKLDKNQRWLPSKRFLYERCGISVHFSAIHRNYFSAWKYVTKQDKEFVQSPGHPDLRDGPPKTTRASFANKPHSTGSHGAEPVPDDSSDCNEESSEDHGQKKNTKTNRKKRMSSYELGEIVVAKKIKSYSELLAFAKEQKLEGKTDVAEFVLNRGSKVVAEVLQTAWDMENSQETLQRQKKSRLQLLYDSLHQECVPDCHGRWVTCAKEVLSRNDISVSGFAQSVRSLLEKGRGKHRNIMLIGPTNCAKTFLLNPLNVIYNTFTNPASGSFAWVGAEKAECIFLNDVRWSSSIIPWHDFLLLLEGQLVHLPAPKTHYAKDLTFKSDTPIFATGKDSFVYTRSGVLDELETDMMAVHWKTYTFHYQISSSRQKELPPCGRCFAELIVGDLECSWD